MFNVNRPGRSSICHTTMGESERNGIVSCQAVSAVLPLYAAGCYDRTVEFYGALRVMLCVLRGHLWGVTQVTFTKDGTKLFAGGRKGNEVLCWDLRQPGMVNTMQREVTTNQTIQFTLSTFQKYLRVAINNGNVRVWVLDIVGGHSDGRHGTLGWVAALHGHNALVLFKY